VALATKSFGEELAKVAEAQNGDLEGLGLEVLGAELKLIVVLWLGGVERADAERGGFLEREREGRGKWKEREGK
jgi:hypothetical protein